jgi:hypothetical protein
MGFSTLEIDFVAPLVSACAYAKRGLSVNQLLIFSDQFMPVVIRFFVPFRFLE